MNKSIFGFPTTNWVKIAYEFSKKIVISDLQITIFQRECNESKNTYYAACHHALVFLYNHVREKTNNLGSDQV